MSMEQKQVLKCPKCGTENEFTMWQSLNTSLNPEMKQQLISGELFQMKCKECGEVTNVNYPILYHDMENKLMLQFVGSDEEAQDVVDTFEGMKQMEQSPMEGYRFRIVRSINSLREKAYIFDKGFDDRAIEMLKLMVFTKLQADDPGLEIAEILLDITEEQPQACSVRTVSGVWLQVSFPADYYDTMFREYVEKLEDTGNDYVVDFVWATETLQKRK